MERAVNQGMIWDSRSRRRLMLNHTQMAELAAIRTFMSWGAFDLIPTTGSISYKALAEKLDADEPLVSKSATSGETLPEASPLTGHLAGRLAWGMVSTGTLRQVGEDEVAHTRLSKVYVNRHASGILFQIM